MRPTRSYLSPVEPRFLFCTYSYPDADVGGDLTVVYLTTRKTFVEHGHIDDSYYGTDSDRLWEICDANGLGELMESTYETMSTPDEIKGFLEAEPDVAHSVELLDFMLSHDHLRSGSYVFPAGVTPTVTPLSRD
jgi:hypothetical protein